MSETPSESTLQDLRRALFQALAELWEGPKRGPERERRRQKVYALRDQVSRLEAEDKGKRNGNTNV